ncbi:MAG: hypothetical protein V4531_07705 [Actinomycetota bacterium]
MLISFVWLGELALPIELIGGVAGISQGDRILARFCRPAMEVSTRPTNAPLGFLSAPSPSPSPPPPTAPGTVDAWTLTGTALGLPSGFADAFRGARSATRSSTS